METGVHVTAVVRGETAGLVRKLDAGDVVEPNSPQQLAELWMSLLSDPVRLKTGGKGREWVQEERESVTPCVIREVMKTVAEV